MIALILGSTALACVDPSPVTVPRVRITPTHVTEDVATRLTADGRFILSTSVVSPPGALDESQAKAIATRYVRDVASSKIGEWTAAHGAAIQPATLTPCDRALYSASPYEPLNATPVSEITVRTFGPHWVVPMCAPGGRLQVVAAFSALATELATNVGSPNQPLPWERSDVMSFGVPLGTFGSMYSPEGAALYAFTAAGKRVSSVPELIMAAMPGSPVLVRWSLDLETPIAVTGARSAASRERGSLLVGFGDTFKSSGLLDRDPTGSPALLTWTDPVTKAPFTVVLTSRASGAVELVTRRTP